MITRSLCALATGLVLAACDAPSPRPSSSLPDAFLGKWFDTGSSGGITGKGFDDEATGWIVIRPDNAIDRYAEDGALAGTIAFTAGRGPTIFSKEDRWILHREGGVPEVITLSDDGRTLSIAENVYDGFVRTYARTR